MVEATESQIEFDVDGQCRVAGLVNASPDAWACLVLAHGAGAGMQHPFLGSVAQGLASRGIATFRYQFPYMQRGSRRPDSPKVAQAAVRCAAREASHIFPKLPAFAGGKSFGGRMTSQAQAEAALPGIIGLVFFGFPLHPASKPSISRADHLKHVEIPMLFLQGSRDALAEPELLRKVVEDLGSGATLKIINEADHSFHVPVRSGRRDSDVITEMLDTAAQWLWPLARK